MRLFGSSGVRGLANVDLTPILAERVGLAVATFSNAKHVVVARDTRVTGQMLEHALVSGLESGGADVICLGVTPTPVLAFLTNKMGADAGVMITASHNPPEYNGIKLFRRDSSAYDEKSQIEIERIIAENRYRRAPWTGVGHTHRSDENHLYSENLRKRVKLRRRWHVVVDPGCGATFSLGPTILQGLGCRVTALNAQPDGWFPARSPEPNSKSLKHLARAVKVLGADIGVAYDGDGDRAAFIDEGGNFADFDRTLAAYAAYVVKKNGGGTVVTSVETSMSMEKMVEPFDGKVERTKVGDVYISETMKKRKALFGGEPCGAWIHPQFHHCPDGILSSALVLKTLEDENKNLAEFLSAAPTYPMFRENFDCKNELKEKALREIGEGLKTVFPEHTEFSTVDGVRLVLKKGWLLVRPSGTEPTMRLTVEGESLKAAKQITEKGAELIKNKLGNGGR